MTLEDVQASNRYRDLNISTSAAEQSKSEAILSSKIIKLEAEKQEAEASLKKARNETTNLRVKVQELSTGANQARNDAKNAVDRAEELDNQHSMNLNSLKMVHTKEKAALQCELDKVKKQLKGRILK